MQKVEVITYATILISTLNCFVHINDDFSQSRVKWKAGCPDGRVLGVTEQVEERR